MPLDTTLTLPLLPNVPTSTTILNHVHHFFTENIVRKEEQIVTMFQMEEQRA